MKKSILMGIFALFTITGNAQLKVDSVGVVTSGKLLVNESDSVYSAGDYGIFSNLFDGQQTLAASICGRIRGYTTPDSNLETAIGVSGKASWGPCIMGVKGEAEAGVKNYGVYGLLPLHSQYPNYGSAIYGTRYYQPLSLGDVYAGYFDGPVGMTEGLRVYGAIMADYVYYRTLSSSSRGELLMGENSGKSTFISDKLSSLDIASFSIPSIEGRESSLSERTGNSKEENTSVVKSENERIEREARDRKHYGIPANQLEEVFPELVMDDGKGNKSINYVEMVPLLVQSIKELSAEVATLKEQLGIQDPSKPVMKVKEQTTAIEETETDVVTMSQNKPNPFSDSSVITLNIPETTKSAVIGIYDMSGKQVQAINVPQRGQTDITVFAAGLTPGMYVYNLIVDGKVQVSRKMIVQHL